MHEPETIAVLSQLDMECGYTAYAITYFSDPPRKLGVFHAGWKSNSDTIVYENGEETWVGSSFLWEYDLEPWLKKGKLLWCEPGSDNTIFSEQPIEKCPFINLPGRRKKQRVFRGKV